MVVAQKVLHGVGVDIGEIYGELFLGAMLDMSNVPHRKANE